MQKNPTGCWKPDLSSEVKKFWQTPIHAINIAGQ